VKVNGKHYRTIWPDESDRRIIRLIDQRALPHQFVVETIRTADEMARAIQEMHVRGAGLIGAAAGYGMYLATLEVGTENSFNQKMIDAASKLKATRPTAVNLARAINLQLSGLSNADDVVSKRETAFRIAGQLADEDAEYCRRIGEHGAELIRRISKQKSGDPVNLLTHCNAGWLAFVDYGSATAPIYAAHDSGIPVHVWVDETRPRNQGSKLTAWELGQHGVPHTIIADNAGGHLMQHGKVDAVIVGSDRTTFTGDVANKIGTYLKALAAKDNAIPFYVALPSSSFDWSMRDGLKEIPIEERASNEVNHAHGWYEGAPMEVRLSPVNSRAANYGFDVTPRHLVTGLITERGICQAAEESILELFPERRRINS
jgi:methylthioribose-1-phosphate isomerase